MRVWSPRPGLCSIRVLALLVLFLAPLALPTSAPAQYPGGGGYPGGGPAPGWTAIPRPGTESWSYPDYDWTGLHVHADFAPFPGPEPEQTFDFPSYEGVPGDNYPITYQASGDMHGAGVGGDGPNAAPGFQTFTLTVSGSSTYKWTWDPPGGDLTDFPAPTLYTLGVLSGSLSTQTYNGNVTGLALSNASLSDGWGWSQSLSSLSGLIQFTGNRSVVPTSADGSLPNTVDAPLSPGLRITLTGAQDGGNGDGYRLLSEAIYPIVLSSPNPLTNPTLGDGTNQFVYSTDLDPNSKLLVPWTATAVGASSADLNWLVSQGAVAWSFDRSIPNQVTPANPTVSGSSIVATTTLGGGTTNNLDFSPLPAKNSDFGTRKLYLTVNNGNSQYATIQTFFPGTAADSVTNYPGAGLPDPSVPKNWYHYYSQVSPSTGTYDNTSNSHTDFFSPYNIHIADDAASHSPIHSSTVSGVLNSFEYSYDLPVFMLANPNDTHKSNYLRLA